MPCALWWSTAPTPVASPICSRALDYLRAVVAESATVIQPGQTYNVQPFKLDPATAHQPTEFEITFLLSGVRHQYAFAMTPQRIVSESLLVYRKHQAHPAL